MICPFCGQPDTRVVDSRDTDDGMRIRRRRECISCQKRFTTYEALEVMPLMVLKRDGTMQLFDRAKLLKSMARACDGRKVTPEQLNDAVNNIESTLQNGLKEDVTTTKIGELVMDHLVELDEPSYIRYASVYRKFTDLNTFAKEIEKLLKRDHPIG